MPPEPEINCVALLPTKNASAITSNLEGFVPNLRLPLSPTNSKPTPE